MDGLLNLLFPDACILCSLPVSRLAERGICRTCWNKALQMRIDGPICPSCGLPFRTLDPSRDHLCGTCETRLPPYSGARAFGWYNAELSRIIQALKFGGRRDLAPQLAALLASTFFEFWSAGDFDLIVPVPLHARRKRERGYNQAELLSRSLAHLAGLPSRNVLLRIRGTRPQVGLSDLERSRNLARAFRCARGATIRGSRLLLVDDVMTTGSTVASAAGALLEGGALRVSVLVLARAVAGIQ
jgi:ComF family protein